MAKDGPAAASTKKRKTLEPPPVDRLVMPAIVIGLAMLAYQFIKGITSEVSECCCVFVCRYRRLPLAGRKGRVAQTRSNDTSAHSYCIWMMPTCISPSHLFFRFFRQIPRVNVLDEAELREVFFGEGTGKSYVVLCHKEESKIPISSVFEGAHKDKSSPAEFRLLDCDHTLASSGKTIAERFKLDLKQRPTIFLSGAVGPPQQISSKHLKTSAMLGKLLRGKLEARTVKIETTQDLRSKCLDKDVCAILLKGSKTSPAYLKDAMGKLIAEHPSVVFASVDATSLYVLNLEEHMVELKDEQPRFAVLQKVSGSLASDSKDRLLTSMAALPTNGVGYGPMSNLVASVVQGTAQMTKLTSLPVIKTRSKKLEEQERAKRQRKLEQQRRQQEKQQSSSSSSSSSGGGGSGYFSANNDGSREGRKAERDRRRADHNREHNVKEKTPEEIAEMERRRRARMAEEATKWNMAPEDAPDEGDYVGGDRDGDIMEDVDEDADAFSRGGGGDGGDEEDVLDLD
jgi:hypothetical protein